MWQSPDPILGKYLPVGDRRDQNLPGIGGAFNPVNLNLYAYAHQNPVRYNDPDGNATAAAGCAIGGGIGAFAGGVGAVPGCISGAAIATAVTGVVIGGAIVWSIIHSHNASNESDDPKSKTAPQVTPNSVSTPAPPPPPEDPENQNDESKQSRPTDRYKKNLDRPTLDAARRELRGEVVKIDPKTGRPFDHVTKVRNEQQGLQNRIEQIRRQLGSPSARLTDAARADLTKELGDASRLLDYSRQFVPPAP